MGILIPRDLRRNRVSTSVWLASKNHDKLRTKALAVSISSQGSGAGMTPGSYDLLQISTNGSGSQLIVNCSVDAAGVTTINSITDGGLGFFVGELVTLSSPDVGLAFTVNPVLSVDSVGS